MDKMQRLHDEAFLYIQQGLTCDEHGQKEQALTLYQKGLASIQEAHQCIEQMKDPELRARSTATLEKMEKSKEKVEMRLALLLSDESVRKAVHDPPPRYDDACTPASPMIEGMPATPVFTIPDGVQIFFIDASGSVSAPSCPSALQVFMVEKRVGRHELPPAFMKVGEWTYPLLPGHSPSLHTDWGAYLFPDVLAEQQGSSVGVIIPDSLDDISRAQFENLLNTMTVYEGSRLPPPRPPPPQVALPSARKDMPSEKQDANVSSSIISGAEWLAGAIETGAHKAGRLIHHGGNKVVERLEPNQEKSQIDSKYQTTAYYARKATHGTVKVASYLEDKLSKATVGLAKYAAPKICGTAKQYFGGDDGGGKSSSSVDGAMQVAGRGIVGACTVYAALARAAQQLARNLADETVMIVDHRYGPEAGTLAENSLYSAVNIGMTAHTVSNFGAKGIAKRVVKDAGKQVAKHYAGAPQEDTVEEEEDSPEYKKLKSQNTD